MRIVLLLCVLTLPASAAWERLVLTPKGERIDKPQPHPLAYFTEFPILRNEGESFCARGCSPETLAELKKIKIKTELTLVGTLNGFLVYDLFYRYETEGSPDTKTILVKIGPNLYREIYHCEPVTGGPVPSQFVNSAGMRLLLARYRVGGKSPDLNDYYLFDQAGSTLLDFGPVLAAAKAALPSGGILRAFLLQGIPGAHYLWNHTFPLLCKLDVFDEAESSRLGFLEVEFRFDHGAVVPTSTRYVAGGDVPQ